MNLLVKCVITKIFTLFFCFVLQYSCDKLPNLSQFSDKFIPIFSFFISDQINFNLLEKLINGYISSQSETTLRSG